MPGLSLEDVDSDIDAQRLVKGELFLPLDNLPALENDQFYFHEIIGFSVIDNELGEVGKVLEHLDIPMNPQLLVDHKGTEVLVPISDHFYTGIDKAKKEIYVCLPPGLIEVNLG